METVKWGRVYEYRTAVMLWGLFGIATFPCPDPTADLITANGVKIEVKGVSGRPLWSLNPRQLRSWAFEFMVLWCKAVAFVVPLAIVKDGVGRGGDISLDQVVGFKERWELISFAERREVRGDG